MTDERPKTLLFAWDYKSSERNEKPFTLYTRTKVKPSEDCIEASFRAHEYDESWYRALYPIASKSFTQGQVPYSLALTWLNCCSARYIQLANELPTHALRKRVLTTYREECYQADGDNFSITPDAKSIEAKALDIANQLITHQSEIDKFARFVSEQMLSWSILDTMREGKRQGIPEDGHEEFYTQLFNVKLNDSVDQKFEEVIWAYCEIYAFEILEEHAPTIDELEQVLGLLKEGVKLQRVSKEIQDKLLPIPKGDVTQSILEALKKTNQWSHDDSGYISYAKSYPDSLSVKHFVSDRGGNPSRLMGETQPVLEQFGPMTVSLNILLSSLAASQPNPWQDAFKVDGYDVLDFINSDTSRLSRTSKTNQLNYLAAHAELLTRILIQIYWEDENEYVWSPSKLWFITPQFRGVQGQLPDRLILKVRPGDWIDFCDIKQNGHRNLLDIGLMPKEALVAQSSSWINALVQFLSTLGSSQASIYDFLCWHLGKSIADKRLTDRRRLREMKQSFQNACRKIAEQNLTVYKIHIVDRSSQWQDSQIVLESNLSQPALLNSDGCLDFKRIREKLEMTPKAFCSAIGISRSQLSKLEHPHKYPTAKLSTQQREAINRLLNS